ncbi:hypothetical protein LUZ60_014566 [Juncus effusus]|nr:hypothetical protein LUZ60_014566 [Juncus effusus]
MAPVSRFLQSYSPPLPLPTSSSTAAPPQPPVAVDSDVVVILAALLCALICVVGLAAVARCAWTRRSNPSAPPNKGLKKKALESLPKFQYQSTDKLSKLAECAICLERFVEGDEVRVLPQCGHGFHAACVDTWLGSHSSCPSCRRILVVPPALPPAPANGRCRMCGGSREADVEIAVKAREDGQSSTSFLP